jgi:predicted secreted protein
MQLGVVTLVAIYVVVWWIVLFAVLPLGAQSHHEAGIDLKDGGDPGAPVTHDLKRKAVTTTWVALIVWAVVAAAAEIALRHWAGA